jgi:hypothetical protein
VERSARVAINAAKAKPGETAAELTQRAQALAVTTQGDRNHKGKDASVELLGQTAANVTEAQYNLDQYLPTTLRVIGLIGRTAITNLKYHSTVATDQAHPDERVEAGLAKALAQRWQQRPDPTSTAEPLVLSRLSTALSYFVSGNSLIALNGSTAAAGSDPGAASRDRIVNEQTFDTQVQVATGENATMARQSGTPASRARS